MEAKIVGSFRINTAGNRTTEEVVAAGNYNRRNNWVDGDNFPMRPMPEGLRQLVLLEFDRKVTSKEALAEATRHGLERPLHEDALLFGEQHSEEQCNASIVFLHEPWQCRSKWMNIIVLRGDAETRTLSLFTVEDRWSRYCRFAFVQP